jgi:hypothetical protein
MSVGIALLLKPFFALALFVAAHFIAKLLMKIVPEGKLRRMLSSPVGRKR